MSYEKEQIIENTKLHEEYRLKRMMVHHRCALELNKVAHERRIKELKFMMENGITYYDNRGK